MGILLFGLVGTLSLSSSASPPEVTPSECFRTWKNADETKSFNGCLAQYDEALKRVVFYGPNGNRYGCDLSRLCAQDQKLVLLFSDTKNKKSTNRQEQEHHRLLATVQSDAPNQIEATEPGHSQEVLDAIEELNRKAKEPILVDELRTRSETVYRTAIQYQKVLQRYGLFGRRCRIVTIRREILVPETITRTETVRIATATLAVNEDAFKTDPQVVLLPAPQSTGAIPGEVGNVLNLIFPQPGTSNGSDAFDMHREDAQFPVIYSSNVPATDNVRYQIAINNVSGSPRELVVKVWAFDVVTSSQEGSEPHAKRRHQQIVEALPK